MLMMIKLYPKPILFLVVMLISLVANSRETTTSSSPSPSSSPSSSKSQAHDHHDDEPILELYMHDVIGGNNPTARPVTGLLGAIYSGHVPFSKPISARPSNGVVPLTAFGTVTVIDDVLTAGPADGAVGRARGVYVASGIATWSVMMAFTAVMEGGEYGDSLSFCGVYLGGSQTTSRLAVVGGTGKYRNVGGFAEVRSLVPSPAQRPQTLLRIRVHLRYR